MISVIVPAYNAAKTLGDCLDSIERQSVRREDYEIVVVDDGSTDSTSRVASERGVRVVGQPNQGPGAARNHGIELALGDTLLFVDADCVPAPDWIERMLEALVDPEVVGVKGAYKTLQRSVLARFIQQEFEEKYDRLCGVRYIDFVDAYSAAYRREVLLETGGFDRRFRLAEDIELSYRLATQGRRMVFQPTAIVYHQHPESLARYVRTKFLSAFWRSQAYRRFPSKVLRDSTTPRVLYLQMPLATLLLASVAGVAMRGEAIPGMVVALLGFVATTAPFVRRAWRRDWAAAAIAPAFLLARALALAAGLATGGVALLLRGVSRQKRIGSWRI